MFNLRAIGCIVCIFAVISFASPTQFPLSAIYPEEQSTRNQWAVNTSISSEFHETYHPLRETTKFLEALKLSYPNNIQLEHVGQSAEGRNITAVVISSPQSKKKKKDKLKKKPRFVLMGAQHAREWIATSTALYLTSALAADKEESWSMRKLLDDFDFYIIPIPNPDGYEYTWGPDRFWYKNTMQVIDVTGCHGIDMNRNWGVGWEPSSSPSEGPCAAWYPGEKPFQAPEVNALADYFKKVRRITAFIDLRSYGQMISAPYSHSCDTLPPDAEDLLEAAHGAAFAVHKVHGTIMKAGILCETLYRAPGNIVDWMYVKNNVKYSYAVHLRDTGTYGYMLPSSWIRPVGEETGSLVSSLAKFIHERG